MVDSHCGIVLLYIDNYNKVNKISTMLQMY